MTNERRFSIWNDAEGRQVQTYLWGNASLATIQAAIAAKSNGALLYNTESADLGPTQASTTGPYNSNVDRAVLLYNDAAGFIVPVVVPMPVDTMFLSDMVTVDATQITAISAAVIGVALSAAGLPAVSFRSGYRSTAGQQPAGIPPSAVTPAWPGIEKSGVLVGQEQNLNLIPGAGVGLTIVDNPGSLRVDATIAATVNAGPGSQYGGTIIEPPPTPQGGTAAFQACNIAAYLAVDVLQASMANLTSSYNSAKLAVDAATALFSVINPFVFLDAAVVAAAIFYNYWSAGTVAAFTTASTDATLAAELKCAIYAAISVDGYVDAGNFAAMVTAVAAVPYGSATVITAIVDYLNHLGLEGVTSLQRIGSLYVGDCSACGAWCYEWGAGFAALNSNWTAYLSNATFSSGLWQSIPDGTGGYKLYLVLTLDPTKTYTSATVLPSMGTSFVQADMIRFYSGAVGSTVLVTWNHVTWTGSVTGAQTLLIGIAGQSSPFTVSALSLRGTGASGSWGASNCI